MSKTPVVIAVHGGAGRLAKRKTEHPGRRRYDAALNEALRAGQNVLLRGGSAVRAATAAVTVLEDNDLFNAGKGAALCADGSVELSASIMNGRNLTVGAMVGLKRTKNPILAARALMEHSHGLLFGEGADAYAETKGLEMVSPDYFFTPFRMRQWQKHKEKDEIGLDHSDGEGSHGTVGAVARDRRGNLAAATSTGGLVNQAPGRVGDTPVVGAGTWADNNVCAVSATGKGDAYARVAFARRVADLIELSQLSPEEAALRVLDDVKRVNGQGGCILLDALGRLAMPFNSRHMLRGWVVENEAPTVAILPGEGVVMDTL